MAERKTAGVSPTPSSFPGWTTGAQARHGPHNSRPNEGLSAAGQWCAASEPEGWHRERDQCRPETKVSLGESYGGGE